MPGCQGHNLLAGGKVTGSHPCTLARGRVPNGGHGKGYLLLGKKKVCYITSCILKQIFQKIRVSWIAEPFHAYFQL